MPPHGRAVRSELGESLVLSGFALAAAALPRRIIINRERTRVRVRDHLYHIAKGEESGTDPHSSPWRLNRSGERNGSCYRTMRCISETFEPSASVWRFMIMLPVGRDLTASVAIFWPWRLKSSVLRTLAVGFA